MDVLESLKNLSGSDKARLIVELLLSDTNNQNDSENPLNNIQRLLVDKSPEKKSPSPKKKQKTLDEWLVKRNDTSKKLVDQRSNHQAAKLDFDKVSETDKNSEEINSGDLTSKNSGSCNENYVTPSTSRLVEKSITNNDLSPSVSKNAEANDLFNEKCASRSKRKVSQSSPGLEREKTAKRVKSTCDKQDYLGNNDGEEVQSNNEKSVINNDCSPCDSKEDETNNLFSKKCASRCRRKVSHPLPGLERERTVKRVKSTNDKQDYVHSNNDGKEIESDKSTDSNCTGESENIAQTNITEDSNLISNKNKYNLRTKAKSLKLVQVEEDSNNKLTTDNNQTDVIRNDINNRSNSTGSISQYEAYCKLNQICKEMSINVSEILKDKNVESVLSDPKIFCNDAIFFIGSHKLNSGKTSPVVHLARSKKKLSEQLVSLQEKLSDRRPT